MTNRDFRPNSAGDSWFGWVFRLLAYANVHTSTSGGGEIRGQIRRWGHR